MISEQFFSLSDEIISINMPDNLSPVICYLFLLPDLSFLHCMLLTSQAAVSYTHLILLYSRGTTRIEKSWQSQLLHS